MKTLFLNLKTINMETKLGIENLKKAVNFSVDLVKQINTSGKDGWNWKDSFAFIDEAMQIPSIAKTAPQILAEIKDLTQEEATELHNYVKIEFNLTDDKVEAIVKDSITIAFSLVSLIEKLK